MPALMGGTAGARTPFAIAAAREVVRRVEEIGRRTPALGLDFLQRRHARVEVRAVLSPRLARRLPPEVYDAEVVAGHGLLRGAARTDLDPFATRDLRAA